jgi:hypothetical protein
MVRVPTVNSLTYGKVLDHPFDIIQLSSCSLCSIKLMHEFEFRNECVCLRINGIDNKDSFGKARTLQRDLDTYRVLCVVNET